VDFSIRMGIVQLALGESERGDVDFESDSDMDEERPYEVVAMPRALRRVEGPGSLKRTYGVRCLACNDSCLERWPNKCAKLDQQLDGLRAVVPNSSRVCTWSLKSINSPPNCNKTRSRGLW